MYIFEDCTYDEAKSMLDLISGDYRKYNGIIMWELKMIQNFDKVVRYDDNVRYFNIEIHKKCHV